jgi:hypothetical protein
MSDRIELRGLRALGLCGILPEEGSRAQPLEVDLEIDADLSVPGASDELGDTIDYSAVCAMVERIITAERRSRRATGKVTRPRPRGPIRPPSKRSTAAAVRRPSGSRAGPRK